MLHVKSWLIAAAMLVASAAESQAQFGLSIGNPYYGSGFAVGYTYGYGGAWVATRGIQHLPANTGYSECLHHGYYGGNSAYAPPPSRGHSLVQLGLPGYAARRSPPMATAVHRPAPTATRTGPTMGPMATGITATAPERRFPAVPAHSVGCSAEIAMMADRSNSTLRFRSRSSPSPLIRRRNRDYRGLRGIIMPSDDVGANRGHAKANEEVMRGMGRLVVLMVLARSVCRSGPGFEPGGDRHAQALLSGQCRAIGLPDCGLYGTSWGVASFGIDPRTYSTFASPYGRRLWLRLSAVPTASCPDDTGSDSGGRALWRRGIPTGRPTATTRSLIRTSRAGPGMAPDRRLCPGIRARAGQPRPTRSISGRVGSHYDRRRPRQGQGHSRPFLFGDEELASRPGGPETRPARRRR